MGDEAGSGGGGQGAAKSEDAEEEEGDDEESEEEEAENGKKYVAAVCQYTTILKDAPPGFDGQKYEVNYMKNIQPMKQVPNYPARGNEVSRKVNIGMRGGNLMIGKRHQEDEDEEDED